jgi:hypothetical protein
MAISPYPWPAPGKRHRTGNLIADTEATGRGVAAFQDSVWRVRSQ